MQPSPDVRRRMYYSAEFNLPLTIGRLALP